VIPSIFVVTPILKVYMGSYLFWRYLKMTQKERVESQPRGLSRPRPRSYAHSYRGSGARLVLVCLLPMHPASAFAWPRRLIRSPCLFQTLDLKNLARSLKRRLLDDAVGLEKVAPAGGLLTPQPSDSEGEDLDPTPTKFPRVSMVSGNGGIVAQTKTNFRLTPTSPTEKLYSKQNSRSL